jgi:hypothetical protein
MSKNQSVSIQNATFYDACTYTIEITGRLTQADIEMICPSGLTVHKKVGLSLAFEVITDQSGLIGLLRHLHSRGVVFVAIRRTPFPLWKGKG